MKAAKKISLRMFIVLCAMVMLVCSLSTASMAATSTSWTTNAGHEALIQQISNEEFKLLGPRNLPTELFSYNPATTDVNTDISTTDISFNIAIEPGAEPHNDFYGIFVFRISDPSSGIWGPHNSGVSLQFNAGQVILRRWSRGTIDTEKVQTMDLDILDGQPHAVSIKVEEYKVSVTVDDQSMSVEYNFIPGSGGYQFMAYNANVHVSNFDDGTTGGEVTPPPTEPQETKPQETKPSTSDQPSEPSDPPYVTIVIVAVVVCAVVGLGYYLLVVKKKK